MLEDSETKYPFLIATRNIDFISRYLNGLKLKENKDYCCLRTIGTISAKMTLQQAEGLKEDMKEFVVTVVLDYNSDDTRLEALRGVDSEARRRLEAIISR